MIYVESGQEPFQSVFVYFRGAPLSRQFSIYLWLAMIFHSGDMFCQAKLCFEEHGFDAVNHSHFKDVDVGN